MHPFVDAAGSGVSLSCGARRRLRWIALCLLATACHSPAAQADTPSSSGRPAATTPRPPDRQTLLRQQRLLAAALATLPPPDAAGISPARPLAPYFFVDSRSPESDRLPLKHNRVTVDVSGDMADVHLTQVYRNEGSRTLEAVYLFPASTRAAVYGLRMRIGERVIEAVIREKQQARRDYEAARDKGQTASLLEQWRPNVLQMNVANIQPGDEIAVALDYVEQIVPESLVYEFVFPTVVGPRYGGAQERPAKADESFVQSPYLKEGQAASYDFAFEATLRSAHGVREVSSPSHAFKVDFPDAQTAHVLLPPSHEAADRDVIVRYTLAGNTIESGLLLHPGEREHYFMLTLQPPRRVETQAIVPREYLFIVDVSGSMSGFPLDTSKTLMRELLSGLRPSDRFNVLTFAGGNQLLSPRSLPATPEHIAQAGAVLSRESGGGGTELLPALRRALALPESGDCARILVILTDGYVSVEQEAFALIRKQLGQANVFAFGIGSSVNRHLIEGLARAGFGEPFVVTKPAEAAAKADSFARAIASPVLQKIRVSMDGFASTSDDLEPQAVPDLFAERPLVITGKYQGPPRGHIHITGQTALGPYSQTIDVAQATVDARSQALPLLWARRRIERLGDALMPEMAGATDAESKRIRGEITQLGLTHHLMTAYTSFIAIDQRIRSHGQPGLRVDQPQPLPRGVSDQAVGGQAMASPMELQQGEEGVMGMGGLGLIGTGMGGGGTGQGTIGLGSIGTIGHGSGTTSGAGYGVGYGRGAGKLAVGRGTLVVRRSGQGPSTVAVQAGAAEVRGALDRTLIQRVVRRHLSELQAIYTQARAKQPTLGAGKLVVRFTIAASGQVIKAALVSSTLGTTEVTDKVLAAIQGWSFPKPSGGAAVVVVYPFTFTP